MSSSSIYGDAAAQHNEQGNAAYKAGQMQEALMHYSRAASCSSSTAKYHTNRANTLMKLDQPKQALEAAESAVTADARWVKGHFWKTAALEELGRLKKALQSCKAGLAVDPSNADLSKAHTRIAAALAVQQQQQQQRRAQQFQQAEYAQEHAYMELTEDEMQELGGVDALGGLTHSADLLGSGVFQQLRSQFVNAGNLKGQDGSPHPFGWTGGLQPLEKRGEWLVDCYRLRCTDDAAAGKLHGAYAPDCTAESLCEDFLHFCTLAERHGVAPAGIKDYAYDAWPGWASMLQLAATRLHMPFTQADAAAEWGSSDAMSRKEMRRWLQHVAKTHGPWGRSLRYTAEVVYGCPANAPEPSDVVQLRGRFEGQWGWLFGDRVRKQQTVMALGSSVSWEEMYAGVQQAWQQQQQEPLGQQI